MTQYKAWFIIEKTYENNIEADSLEDAETIANDSWDINKWKKENKSFEKDYRLVVQEDDY
ncbi:hypothetical protein N9998_00260 [Nitrosopumilus sp.]|nr:hypothetical protein [Nitrosopumilus sp.]